MAKLKKIIESGSSPSSNVAIAATIATHLIFQDDKKRMTKDEYISFLVAQGMGRAQAEVFAASHYHG